VIAKRSDGTWVVVLTSGYNNVDPGSGHGTLFVLNAATGALLMRIDTGAGSHAQPAGLTQLNAWVDNLLDNTAARLYGGDLLGNVWRFDIGDPAQLPGARALRLAQLVRNGVAQPVTVRPALSLVRAGSQSIPLVSVGTGRYLGITDVQDKSVQSVYTFKDTLTSSALGDLRSLPTMVRQELSGGGDAALRSITRKPVDWLTDAGWYLDLDVQADSGERVTLDLEQQFGRLYLVANAPDTNPCRPRAESWFYVLQYQDGSYVPLNEGSVAGRRNSLASLAAGAHLIRVGARPVMMMTDENGTLTSVAQSPVGGSASAVRRVSWRELD
jgi:type IV pilus assembly protein PilY1